MSDDISTPMPSLHSFPSALHFKLMQPNHALLTILHGHKSLGQISRLPLRALCHLLLRRLLDGLAMLLLRALKLDLPPATADHRHARITSPTLHHVPSPRALPRSGADIVLTGCCRCNVAATVSGGIPAGRRPFIAAIPVSQEETLG